MKKSILSLSILTALLVCISCGQGRDRIATEAAAPERTAHPSWAYSAVIYEMNLRQYTPEGTFAAAARELPRLQQLGVDVIWLMPIYPIGEVGRKGSMGSYYAVRDYCAVNPEFGSMEDFEAFLEAAHEAGFKLILDWVANHTSPDAVWESGKPADWYERDRKGGTIFQYDWSDTAELNYDNRDMRAGMEAAMRFWMDKGIDGFRCDMASELPVNFWQETLPKLREDYPGSYFLAEGEAVELHEGAFDTSYAWVLHHLLNDIAQGTKGAADLKDYVAADAQLYPAEAFRLMFTSNHDENSWAGTEFKRMGEAVRTMALLTFVLPQGQPLLYTGQEMGFDHSFEFFEKDNVPEWKWNGWSDYYRQLIELRHCCKALDAGEGGAALEWLGSKNDPENLLMMRRGNVVVVANLSAEPCEALLPLSRKAVEYFTGVKYKKGATVVLPAWGSLVFVVD